MRQVQVLGANESYMSPLEYDTDSDDENHEQARTENSVCKTQRQNVGMSQSQSHFGVTNRSNGFSLCRLAHQLAIGHAQGKTYNCYICKNSYKSNQWLRSHMKSMHTDHIQFRYRCSFPECLKSYTQKSSLNQHAKLKHNYKIASRNPTAKILLRKYH